MSKDITLQKVVKLKDFLQARNIEGYLGQNYNCIHTIDASMQIIEQIEQENETLRSANEDLLKENRTLKNFKKVDIDHSSNGFF